MNSIDLVSHPDTPSGAVREIRASIEIERGARLAVSYVLRGVLDQVRIGGEAPPGDALWQHTCFELFVGATNDAEYYEFNFSPAPAWALYGFRGYRDGALMKVENFAPKITVRRDADELRLEADIPLDCLPDVHGGVQLSVGISAVIEGMDGTFSYWAIKHPPGRPDFHHGDNFAVQIEVPPAPERDRDYAANA